MPKEKPLYRDTLERFRKRADELYPKKRNEPPQLSNRQLTDINIYYGVSTISGRVFLWM